MYRNNTSLTFKHLKTIRELLLTKIDVLSPKDNDEHLEEVLHHVEMDMIYRIEEEHHKKLLRGNAYGKRKNT